jgi:hypothetical protein
MVPVDLPTGRRSPMPSPRPPRERSKTRPRWRQRLIESEQGLRDGLRGDSWLYVHFFVASVVAAGALVLGFSVTEWALLLLAFTIVLSAEMFHQMLQVAAREHFVFPLNRMRPVLRLATAGANVAVLGSLGVTLLLFAHRVWALRHG